MGRYDRGRKKGIKDTVPGIAKGRGSFMEHPAFRVLLAVRSNLLAILGVALSNDTNHSENADNHREDLIVPQAGVFQGDGKAGTEEGNDALPIVREKHYRTTFLGGRGQPCLIHAEIAVPGQSVA